MIRTATARSLPADPPGSTVEPGFSPLRATSAPLRITARGFFDAAPDELWGHVADPSALAEWLPLVSGMVVDGFGPCDVGVRRIVSLRGLGTIVEEILHWDAPHRYAYRVASHRLPIKDHVAAVRVTPVEGGQSFLVWEQYYDPRGLIRGHLFQRAMVALMRRGLGRLQRELGGDGLVVRRMG